MGEIKIVQIFVCRYSQQQRNKNQHQIFLFIGCFRYELVHVVAITR